MQYVDQEQGGAKDMLIRGSTSAPSEAWLCAEKSRTNIPNIVGGVLRSILLDSNQKAEAHYHQWR